MKQRTTYIGAYKYIYFILAGFLFLLIASRSSFLYPFNNWDDANSYFSVGKALFNGKMPYRDVFDQKGMYLYFLYGLSYLISHTTFAGVFILELILGFFDIAGFYKIIALYTKDRTAIILAPVTYAIILSSRSFWWGGAAEEICLPFMIWGLYLSLEYFSRYYGKGKMSYKTVLLGGILAGFIANIKFTLLGFFFAWMMCVGISFLMHKDLKGGIKACIVFLFGMTLPFVPWLIYFGIRSGLYEWYWGYVYVNVFVYSDLNGEGPGLYERIYKLSKILYWLVIKDWQYFIFIIIGMLYAIFKRGEKLLARINVICLFTFLFVGIFIGGIELPYYSLPLAIFAVLGVAFIGVLCEGPTGKKKNMPSGKSAALSAVITLLLAIFIYFNSINTGFMKQDKESFFLYRFRDKVLETENPTLLNIGCLDAGLYTLCDIVPSVRFFQTQTINVPESGNNPYREQERYIREGLTDYILARNDYPDYIYDNYDIIDYADYGWYDMEFTYYLFKKK